MEVYELLEIIEEFETVSDIKKFFEDNCKHRALKKFNTKDIKSKVSNKYTTSILVKDIIGFNNKSYENRTPLDIINTEENMDNALKVVINNPDYLLEDYSKTSLSFNLIKNHNDENQYFLNAKANHRVLILLVLSDICNELKLDDIEVLEY